MDPELQKAADDGDVEFLRKAFATQPPEYFLARVPEKDEDWARENILHIAAWRDQLDFIEEAVKILPKDTLRQLLFQSSDASNRLPLHAATIWSEVNCKIVVIFKELYSSFNLSYEDEDGLVVKPWLAVTEDKKMTALHLALDCGDTDNEDCAMEILGMDEELVSCTMVDSEGNTPLYYALMSGFNKVAMAILTSPIASSSPDSVFQSSDELATPFKYTGDCSDDVMKLLFEKWGEWLDKTDDKGFTVIHQWAKDGQASACNKILYEDYVDDALRNKVFKRKIREKDANGDTPLHIAARYEDSEVGIVFLDGHKKVWDENTEIGPMECPPWTLKNKDGNTPIHVALGNEDSDHEKLALEMLRIDPSLSKIFNNKGESLFFLAVHSGCKDVVEKIMKNEPSLRMVRRNDGTTVLHGLSSCPEEIGEKVLQKYWWLMKVQDPSKKTALDRVKDKIARDPDIEDEVFWLINLLNHPSLITKEDFNWIEPCERGDTFAVVNFIDCCKDLQNTCLKEKDTPLHHIQLSSSEEYLHFLNIQEVSELKNTVDYRGATALHRALEREDINFARELLRDKEVERFLPDHYGTTSMDLLADLCKKNKLWQEMCKEIKVNPNLKISYIYRQGTNLDQIRSTVSVVAALLATITFAAAFTLPGGLDDKSGEAKFGKRLGFIIFLLADVYAMCTSMLVLFCLFWSMVSDPDTARLLVDRSVFLLMNSLYGTLLAFMAGIYTMIKHKALWVAIVIFVMCSIIGVLANRTILIYFVKRFPAGRNKKKPNRQPSLEEGHGGSSTLGSATAFKAE